MDIDCRRNFLVFESTMVLWRVDLCTRLKSFSKHLYPISPVIFVPLMRPQFFHEVCQIILWATQNGDLFSMVSPSTWWELSCQANDGHSQTSVKHGIPAEPVKCAWPLLNMPAHYIILVKGLLMWRLHVPHCLAPSSFLHRFTIITVECYVTGISWTAG